MGAAFIPPPPRSGKASECSMSHVTYKIVQHDGGWAYTVDGVFSEAFATPAAALAAAKRAARSQRPHPPPGRRRPPRDGGRPPAVAHQGTSMAVIQREFYRSARGPSPGDGGWWGRLLVG